MDSAGAYQSLTTVDEAHEGTSFEEMRLAEEAIGLPAYTGPSITVAPPTWMQKQRFPLHQDAM